jgi:uncharacterized repeat protein (TIGR02543 family)
VNSVLNKIISSLLITIVLLVIYPHQSIIAQSTYILTVNYDDEKGSVILDPPGGIYVFMMSVNITAVAADGWSFTEWSGNVSGMDNPLTITMDGDKTVTANFARSSYTLTINIIGSGSVTKDPDQSEYKPGTNVDITAVAADGWSFTGWSGNVSGMDNPLTITMDEDKTVTATFIEKKYKLTINIFGSGSVTKDPNQLEYNSGASVNMTAEPADGWTFAGWSGSISGTALSQAIIMDSDKIVTANFTQAKYTLTVNIDGSGNIRKDPDQLEYNSGASVNMTAEPADGWTFAGWSGSINGTANPQNIIIDTNKTVTASFTQNTYNLTINVIGNGEVAKNPDQVAYIYGAEVQLSAIPHSGWVFDSWSGALTGHENTKSVTVNDNFTIQANFKIQASGGGDLPVGGGGGTVIIPGGPGTTQLTPYTNSSGLFVLETAVKSEDNMVMLYISKGVLGQTKEKVPLKSVQVIPISSPGPVSQGYRLIGKTYEITPEGANFSPSISLAIYYDLTSLPGDIDIDSISIVFFNSDTSSWETIPSILDKTESSFTASINHFSIFTLSGKEKESPVITIPPWVEQPHFSISDLSVNPALASYEQTISISINVNNSGKVSGEFEATLKINGTVESRKSSSIAAGADAVIVFYVTRNEPGDYIVDINGMNASFSIKQVPTANSTSQVTDTTGPIGQGRSNPSEGRQMVWGALIFSSISIIVILLVVLIINKRKTI